MILNPSISVGLRQSQGLMHLQLHQRKSQKALAIKEACFILVELSDYISFSTSITSVISIDKNQTAGYHSYNDYKTSEKGHIFTVPVGFADCLPIFF